MADYTAYPSANDVELKLKSIGAWPTDSTMETYAREECGVAVLGAISEWEIRTGWPEFLVSSGSSATARTLYIETGTASSGVVALNAGALTISSVTITPDGDGTTAVEAAMYRKMPGDAISRGKPYFWLYFRPDYAARLWSMWKSLPLTVTGRWGYCETLPQDVFDAILQVSAVNALASVENVQNVASISQDGFSKALDVVGVISQKDLLTTWGKEFDKVAVRYKRPVV